MLFMAVSATALPDGTAFGELREVVSAAKTRFCLMLLALTAVANVLFTEDFRSSTAGCKRMQAARGALAVLAWLKRY